ncbi:uncharacterized protein MYCFIDRAFT_208286 [Pseudocercospora fijiensis CIRAD86]|uniref:Uncharacterized protein n=1 Tax=Pseudocercospora fijiensis (strain CIRAD86) TaxID=383855 RepID=M3AUR0_PSEFD|nr:uncharacterized protein MYCFIDRAFT_208286 [Pseudocercospora fijiensis CIRAD86]EME81207.1 hypothetical protein MYCFIDRAFT_208286 [Pseudocercospora fijiensis CIRAD86]
MKMDLRCFDRKGGGVDVIIKFLRNLAKASRIRIQASSEWAETVERSATNRQSWLVSQAFCPDPCDGMIGYVLAVHPKIATSDHRCMLVKTSFLWAIILPTRSLPVSLSLETFQRGFPRPVELIFSRTVGYLNNFKPDEWLGSTCLDIPLLKSHFFAERIADYHLASSIDRILTQRCNRAGSG